MIVIEKNSGTKIEYRANKTKLTFGDDELMLYLSKYQRDWPVCIDICANRDGMLVVGTGDGLFYVAQIEVPPISYTDTPDDSDTGGQPLPLNMADVTLTLWSVASPVDGETSKE